MSCHWVLPILCPVQAAVSEWTLDLVGEGDPRRLNAAGVSVDFLPLLRVSPLLGRNFSVEEDLPDAGPVAIVSHRLWQTHWAGDPDILGKRITLSGIIYTVVGVLPSEFRYPEVLNFDAVDVLYPYQLNIPLKPRTRSTRSRARPPNKAACVVT